MCLEDSFSFLVLVFKMTTKQPCSIAFCSWHQNHIFCKHTVQPYLHPTFISLCLKATRVLGSCQSFFQADFLNKKKRKEKEKLDRNYLLALEAFCLVSGFQVKYTAFWIGIHQAFFWPHFINFQLRFLGMTFQLEVSFT